MYLDNCKNEAHVTGDMALLGHEVELHNYGLELLASQPDTQLTIPEELKQKYGQRKITNKFVQNAEENWNAKLKVFYIVFSNSLIIHQIKRKKIVSVKEVWIPGLNQHIF